MRRTYRPRLSIAFGALVMALMFLGFPVFLLAAVWRRPMQGDPWLVYPPFFIIFLILLAFSLYFLYGAYFCCATIETDDQGITRRTLLGEARLAWRNLARFEVTGTSQDDYDLWDAQGSRLDVNPSVVQGGAELDGELQARIAPLRESMIREWRSAGAEFRAVMPFGPAVLACLLLMVALCFYGAFAALRIPISSSSDRAWSIVGSCLSGAFGLLLAWAIAHGWTRVHRLTHDAIEVRSLTFRRAIPYSEIVSIMTREFQNQGSSQQITTVRGRNNAKIMITAQLPNCTAIVEYLQDRAGSSVLAEGAEDIKKETQKQERIGIKFLIFASPIYLGMFVGTPFLIQHRGSERLATYRKIGAQGVQADAVVTDKTTSGSKNTEYILEYQFHAPGSPRPLSGRSPVDYDTWERAEVGQKVTALYVPSDPKLCRLTISTSGELAKGEIRSSYFYLGMGLLATGLYGYMIVRIRMRQKGKWTDPALPAATRLQEDRLNDVRREIRRIGFARVLGMRLMSGGILMFMLLGVCLLIASQLVPAVNHLMMARHTPRWQSLMIFSPGLVALAGAFIAMPLGELYANIRTRALQDQMADPRLAADLIRALKNSTAMESNLSGSASLRLLNALTAALGSSEVEITAEQRHFLYKLLEKWQNMEARTAFSVAVLKRISGWNDSAGINAARKISRTSNLTELRQAAEIALDPAGKSTPTNI